MKSLKTLITVSYWLIHSRYHFAEKFNDAMDNHPLRKEIIATKLANNIVNDMGLNFMVRMHEKQVLTKQKSLLFNCKEVFQMPETWSSIVALDNKIPAVAQTEMLYQLRRTVRRATRWFYVIAIKHKRLSKQLSSLH